MAPSPLPVFPSRRWLRRRTGPKDRLTCDGDPASVPLRTPGGNTKTRRSAIAALVAVARVDQCAISTGSTTSSTPSLRPRRPLLPPPQPKRAAARPRRRPSRPRRTQERLEALAEARPEGTAGVRTAASSLDPAPGWAGEHVLNAKADDSKPAIAAEPVLAIRLRGRDPLRGPSPAPGTALPRGWHCRCHKDGGATWGAQRPLCACKGSGQFDPIIEVVPDTGAIYFAVHERVQRDVHPLQRSRQDLVGTGQDLRQGQLEQQTGPRSERRWSRRLRQLERPEGRRSVARPVPRRRQDMDPDPPGERREVLLRVRRGRDVQRTRGLRRGGGDVRGAAPDWTDPPRCTPSSPTIGARPGATSSWTRSRRRSPARTAARTTTRDTWRSRPTLGARSRSHTTRRRPITGCSASTCVARPTGGAGATARHSRSTASTRPRP